MRGAHAFLEGRDVVRNAPEFHGLMFEISDGKTCTGIAVALLADGARIQKIAAGFVDAQRGKRLGSPRTNLEYFEIGVEIRKAALMMRVPEESDRSGRIEKAVKSLRGREDIFIFILKRAVYQNDAVRGERPMGKRGKPREVLCISLATRPVHGGFRDGIEVGGVHQPRDGFVMIAANGLCTKFAQAG